MKGWMERWDECWVLLGEEWSFFFIFLLNVNILLFYPWGHCFFHILGKV